MKLTLQLALWTLAPLVWATPVQAEYKEAMDPNGLTKHLSSDEVVAVASAQRQSISPVPGRAAEPGPDLNLLGIFRRSGTELDSAIRPLLVASTDVTIGDAKRAGGDRDFSAPDRLPSSPIEMAKGLVEFGRRRLAASSARAQNHHHGEQRNGGGQVVKISNHCHR